MFHETLTPLALIAFMLVAKPISAADLLVDGVPLQGTQKWQPLWSRIAPNFGNGRESGSVPGVER